MSDTSGIQGGPSPHYSKEELERYAQDYKKGLNLFQKSFEDYNKPDVEFHKKKQLKKVMDETLQVMNETARIALEKGKLENERNLNIDYQDFLKNPTPVNQKKVADDLKALSE